MPARSEKALREAAINIAQLLPDDDDARIICEMALRLRNWRDRGEAMAGDNKPSLTTVKR